MMPNQHKLVVRQKTMRLAYCMTLVLLLSACGTSKRNYHTVIDARNAGVFTQHYLPDVIPASSTEIDVETKWWSRKASGVFLFDPSDRQAFFSRLQKPLDARVWGEWSKEAPYFASKGVAALGYASPDGRWLFFCAECQDCAICSWVKF
jgi:hypothetical protein